MTTAEFQRLSLIAAGVDLSEIPAILDTATWRRLMIAALVAAGQHGHAIKLEELSDVKISYPTVNGQSVIRFNDEWINAFPAFSQLIDVVLDDPQPGQLLQYNLAGELANVDATPELVGAAPSAPIAGMFISRAAPQLLYKPWYGAYVTIENFAGEPRYTKGDYEVFFDEAGNYGVPDVWVLLDNQTDTAIARRAGSEFGTGWTMLTGQPAMQTEPQASTYAYNNDPRLGGPSSITLCHTTTTLANGGQTYYFGYPYDLTAVITQENRTFQFPFDGRLDFVYLGAFTGSTAPVGQNPSGANLYLRNVTDGTEVLLLTGIMYGTLTNRMVNFQEAFYNSQIRVNNEDEYVMKIVSPTFTTGPSIRHYCNLYFTRIN